MKLFITITLSLFLINSFGQDTLRVSKKPEKDNVMLVGYYKNDDGCTYKAIKIFDSGTLFIDSCYDIGIQVFERDLTSETKPTSNYTKLYHYAVKDWKKIETELSTNPKNCDHTLGFEIHVTKNNTTTIFKLARRTNCYPPSVKKTMEILEQIFNIKNEGEPVDFFER